MGTHDNVYPTHYTQAMNLDEFDTALQNARGHTDKAERAKALGELLAHVPDFQAALRAERQQVVRSMHDDDKLSWAQIGEKLGVARTRAAQIASGVTGGAKKKPAPVSDE